MSIFTIITTILGLAGGLLGVLKTNGINTGEVGAAATTIVSTTTEDLSDYENGQAVVVSTISVGGKAGVLVAMDTAGAAYATLFGSTS